MQLGFDDLPSDDGGSVSSFAVAATHQVPEGYGWRGPTACQIVGITYRQLDYWARTHLVEPSVASAAGSGSKRLYSYRDLLTLKVVKRLLDSGISLGNVRTATEELSRYSDTDLTAATLMSDGVSVYLLTDTDDVVDLLSSGQGVFGITIAAPAKELIATIAAFPAVTDDPTIDVRTAMAATGVDELAKRRRSQKAG